MKELNKIQTEILRKFMYNEKLKYNQIWSKNICSSSNFDYHLKILINNGILKKQDEYYILTSEGTSVVTSIDGVLIKDKKKPVVCSFILAVNENNKILFSIRKKQPYFDHLNIPGGKQEYGEFSDHTGIREFEEETGLKCDTKLMMITEKMTINLDEENSVEHQILGYFYLGYNIKGNLIEKTREGENIWIELEDLKKYKRFPDLDFIVPYMLNKKNPIKIAQIKRFRKGGEFVDIEIKEMN